MNNDLFVNEIIVLASELALTVMIKCVMMLLNRLISKKCKTPAFDLRQDKPLYVKICALCE